jgi:tRNA threonylcarbamoyladenosine biosynthesis protein TsaE
MSLTWTTHSPEETHALGGKILDQLGGRGILLLKGDLGAGKTCLVQGMAASLGIEEPVTSPTYGLVKEYGDPPIFVHADLYRLGEAEELWELNLEDWLDGSVLFAVEWPERAREVWPDDAWHLNIKTDPHQEHVRTFTLFQGGER